MRLTPLALRLMRRPGPLLPQIEAALQVHGRPLRWAITAVQPGDQGDELLLEAVMLTPVLWAAANADEGDPSWPEDGPG